jgi:hypothetical protein
LISSYWALTFPLGRRSLTFPLGRRYEAGLGEKRDTFARMREIVATSWDPMLEDWV